MMIINILAYMAVEHAMDMIHHNLTHQVWSSYLSEHCEKRLSYGKPMYNKNITNNSQI